MIFLYYEKSETDRSWFSDDAGVWFCSLQMSDIGQ